MPPLPEDIVTLLMGDVEGSVGWWEADREAMGAASRRLDKIVSRAADEHGGVRPVEQGEGDSFVLAFGRASDAIGCALDVQRVLGREPRPGELGLRVRMGIHTGEIEIRDGRFYEGSTINRCARLRDLGHGGQTLVSQATRDVVADRLPDGATLDNLGRHALRGFERHEHVYALRHVDLPSDLPVLRSPGDGSDRLPLALTSFVGREQERRRVRELLNRSRLVTLTGAGGSGKTRLATEVVRELAGGFEAGAWWIDLAPLSEVALVPSTVAAALGVPESASENVLDTVVRELDDDRLVVLDNCEHLVATCAELTARILAGCPGVVFVATSREPLGIDGEVTYLVPSLATPDDEPVTLGELSAFPATQLFVDRAALVHPDAVYSDEDAAVIAGICRRLDGLPLAIELAAARTRLMTPAQILDGLADRFHLLTGGARTAIPRHRTLEASVDWSYHLLDEPERVLLARLSVFAGSFDLATVTEVCVGGPIDASEVLDLLTHLVDRSLVQVERSSGQARYRLLETLRMYARRKLADAGEAAEVRNRHLDHYVALAETAAPHLRTRESEVWLVRLDSELANLRAAMDWALTAGQPEKQLRISGALLIYWILRSLYTEIRLRMVAGLESTRDDPAARAKALSSAALVSVMAGDYRAAKALAREGVDISRELDDTRSLQQCLTYLSWAEHWLGEGGVHHVEEALQLAEHLGDAVLERSAWVYLAVVRTQQLPCVADADALFLRPLRAAQADGNQYAEGVIGYFRSFAYVTFGHPREAAEMLERAVAFNEQIGNQTFVVFSLALLAYTQALLGRLDEATANLRAARANARGLGAQPQLYTDANAGIVALAAGRLEEAVAILTHAAERWQTMGNLQVAASCHVWLAEARLLRDDAEAASAAVNEALTISERGGFRWSATHARRILGRLTLVRGDVAGATDHLNAALDVLRERDDPHGTVQVLEVLAEVASADSDHARAVRLLAAAGVESGRHGFARIPQYRQVLDAVLDHARDALGDEEFRAVWDDGAGLSLDEAVA